MIFNISIYLIGLYLLFRWKNSFKIYPPAYHEEYDPFTQRRFRKVRRQDWLEIEWYEREWKVIPEKYMFIHGMRCFVCLLILLYITFGALIII